MIASLVAFGVATLAAQTGRAQNRPAFKRLDDLVRAAEPLSGPRAVASMFWAQLSTCAGIKSDFRRRQCEGLRAARQEQIAGALYLVDGGPGALVAGAWDPDSKAIEVAVTSCIACDAPLPVLGGLHYVVGGWGGGEGPAIEGASLRGPVLTKFSRSLADEKKADAWRKDVLPRLRVEYVFRVPAAATPWTQGDVSGLAVEIAGYRVYDRCTGKVLAASTRTASVAPDKGYCKDEPVQAKPVQVEPTGPVLPAQLTPADITEALAPATTAAQKCYEIYGVAGNARFRIAIKNTGEIEELEQVGDFLDTPTGACIEKAVRATEFPRTRKPLTRVDYPFVLR